MRLLTKSEIDIVAGGWGQSSITVTAPEPWWPPLDDGNGNDPNPDPSGPWSGGGDGGNNPDPDSPCEQDAKEDALASAISDLIKQQPDWHEREYGALVVRYDDGTYGVTGLARGQTVAEARALGLDAPQTAFSYNGPGTIVGAIHSHPDVGYNAAEDIQNQYPSYYLDSSGKPSGDYGLFDALIGHDSRFPTSADQFTHYVLGPDGVLREFSLKDGHLNPSNDTNPASRSNLAADRPCG